MTDSSSLLEACRELRGQIDAALDRYSSYGEAVPANLAAAIRHSLLAPGKRLRPILVLLAAEACGCERRKALPAACAVEMIHTYSLIHDDLPAMDDDDLRRGLPTCHVKFGEATAILAGDALLAQAFEVLAGSELPPAAIAKACGELAAAAGPKELVGGQADDLAQEEKTDGDLNDLQAIHRRKTGAMFRVSLRLGGITAGANEAQLNALQIYGDRLGLAFQIVDDLLDLQGTAEQLGKRTGKDDGRGKLTFPRLLGREESRQRAEGLIDEACAAVAVFETRGELLRDLAQFVLARDH